VVTAEAGGENETIEDVRKEAEAVAGLDAVDEPNEEALQYGHSILRQSRSQP
jgi:hypothetical protein